MTFTMVLMGLLIVLEGALMAATPYLMPPTECFAVTVPPSAQRDSRVRAYKRVFAAAVLATSVVTALALGGVVAPVTHVPQPSSEQLNALAVTITAAMMAPLLSGLALMLAFRARVRQLKHERGWKPQATQAAAVVGEDVPHPISLAWNLLYVPLLLAMVAISLSTYDLFPERIPMQSDLAGNVTGYATKSVGSVLFPAMTAAFMGIIMAASHAVIVASKRPVDPAAPASSAYAYGRFARLQSEMLLVGGLLICAVVGVCFYLSALGRISIAAAGCLLTVTVIALVIAVVGVSAATGQAGGRLAASLRTSDALANDDDALWRLGVFYCNADDPSIFVPKRFGVGWTINVAQPVAWLCVAGLIAVTVAFVVLIDWAVG